MAYKKIFGDYDTTNTFTIYEMKDNSGNKQFRIGTTDDSTTGIGLLLIPVIILGIAIYGIYKFVIYIKKERENKIFQENYWKKFREDQEANGR